jgi:leader peptidase (prepilin peptidase)/N-methyltransferase
MELFLLALVGWLIGALINRAADNLPTHRALFDATRCPYCDTPRPVLDQIAVLSFLLFRGRCPNCRAPIALRAPLVEIASALAFAFLWTRYGASPSAGSGRLLLTAIYTTVFLLVLVIDLEHRLILNIVILPATLFAALASPLSPPGIARSLLGGVIAYACVLAIYIFAHVFSRVRKHNLAVPFGFGDVKLAGFMGVVTGFPAAFTAILLAILLGGAGAILFLVYQLIAHRRLALGAAIPYGPFFCIAGWVMMVFGS